MKIVSFSKSRVAIVLLMSIVVASILSFLVINDLNTVIVPSELYSNGLVFDSGMATNYWRYLQVTFLSIGSGAVLASLAAVFVFVYLKTGNENSRTVASLFVGICSFTSLFAVLGYDSMSRVVNQGIITLSLPLENPLYKVLQPPVVVFLGLQAVIAALGVGCFALLLASGKTEVRISFPTTVSLSMLVVGAGLSGSAFLYESTIPLVAGIGLIFCGSVMSYVSAESYVKRAVVEATSLSYLTSLREELNRRDPLSKMVFLPSKYIQDNKGNRVFVADASEGEIEACERILSGKDLERNPTLMLAPGIELLKLFEKTARKSFSKANVSFFERAVPKLIIEDWDLAENVKVAVIGDTVNIRLENPVDAGFFAKAKESKFDSSFYFVSVPLLGAFGCALADCSGKPVTMRSPVISENGKIVALEYALLSSKDGVF